MPRLDKHTASAQELTGTVLNGSSIMTSFLTCLAGVDQSQGSTGTPQLHFGARL
jgi:hypothetical protein